MARKKRGGDGGGLPDWLVTFGDLMSLLVTFFVLIISYSVQDDQKVQVVAGSIQQAFGVQKDSQRTGVIEIRGIPTRKFSRQETLTTELDDSSIGAFESTGAADASKTRDDLGGRAQEQTKQLAMRQTMLAAATLRQSWKSMPDIAELSDNILVEETPEGVNVQLSDQEGRPMFAPGSRYPFEHTRAALHALVPILNRLPNRIVITGHTARGTSEAAEMENWEVSSGRANETRQILSEGGLQADRVLAVQGKASVEPLFPNNPEMRANARVTIQLIAESPPVPPNLTP